MESAFGKLSSHHTHWLGLPLKKTWPLDCLRVWQTLPRNWSEQDRWPPLPVLAGNKR